VDWTFLDSMHLQVIERPRYHQRSPAGDLNFTDLDADDVVADGQDPLNFDHLNFLLTNICL